MNKVLFMICMINICLTLNYPEADNYQTFYLNGN
jgi:hypothetical protein